MTEHLTIKFSIQRGQNKSFTEKLIVQPAPDMTYEDLAILLMDHFAAFVEDEFEAAQKPLFREPKKPRRLSVVKE